MKTINNILDLAKDLNKLPSDRQLALKLGVSVVSRYRKRYRNTQRPNSHQVS